MIKFVYCIRKRADLTDEEFRVVSSAKEQGATNMELNVLPDKKAALAFWQRLGLTLHLYDLQMTV